MPTPLAWLLMLAFVAAFAGCFALAARALDRLTAQLQALTSAVERLSARVSLTSDSAPVAPAAMEALESARTEQQAPPPVLTVDELQARLHAAQEAGDVDGLLAYYDQLAPRLDAEARGPLDTRLLRWFLDRLMRRMRGGTVAADVATLAARIADRFPATREGAALRASLPTLRRSAGLCAECARPYQGDEDLCPECTARRADHEPATLPLHSWPADDPSAPSPSLP
jgi:hypothetical protein